VATALDSFEESGSGWRLFVNRAKVVARTARLFWKFSFDKPAYTRPRGQIPVVKLTREGLLASPDRTLWRLGHSSVLMKLRGEFWLTDPVFAKRASPLWFAGPKRFHTTPISIKDLPPIKTVLISHDHYDHLDRVAIRKLAKKTETFLTPPGVGALLQKWGVKAEQIRELSWWQETEIAGVRVASTPTQHFSGRSLFNRNQTGWTSYVIIDDDVRLFYSADSGYFDGFRQIGAKYGPFDVALIENGAYNVRWPVVHMQPEETVQAHRDVRGRWLLPIHNGTFDLAMHPWTEPMERVQKLAAEQRISVATPRFGEPVSITATTSGDCWWRSVEAPQTQTTNAGELQAEHEPAR
jgi:L-ascorbate metabolism protein UlaG (beta-lactamase superfamily)